MCLKYLFEVKLWIHRDIDFENDLWIGRWYNTNKLLIFAVYYAMLYIVGKLRRGLFVPDPITYIRAIKYA